MVIVRKNMYIGYQVKCRKCKCIFRCRFNEVTRGVGTGRLLTVCPSCNETVYYNPFTWRKGRFNG